MMTEPTKKLKKPEFFDVPGLTSDLGSRSETPSFVRHVQPDALPMILCCLLLSTAAFLGFKTTVLATDVKAVDSGLADVRVEIEATKGSVQSLSQKVDAATKQQDEMRAELKEIRALILEQINKQQQIAIPKQMNTPENRF